MPEPDEDMPTSPFTEIQACAAQFHELFTAYVNAGFTRAEALTLLRDNIRNAQMNQGNDPG
jgi:hypothetical protein